MTVLSGAWPEDVSVPQLLGDCPLPLPPPGRAEPLRWTVAGEIGANGVFTSSDAAAPDLSTCRFLPAVFQEQPIAVPATLELVGPEPPVTLTLQLRLRGDGGPIPGMQLGIGDQLVTSDGEGRAAFRNVTGPVDVRVLDLRYRVVKPSFEVDEPNQDLWLASEEGWELVARYSADGDRPGVQVITKEEIALAPGTAGDPIRALANRPGLVRTPFESGFLLVRGGDPGHTGVFLEGVRIPLLYHLGGFTSIIHPEFTERVEFWPGATPARYGRSLAGVANVVPRKLGKKRQLVAGANLIFAHAFLEVPTRHGGFAVSFRRSYLDGVLSAVVGPQRARIAPRFWDVNARLAGNNYSITFLGLSDSIDAPSGNGTDVVSIGQTAGQLQARFKIPVRQLELEISPWLASWRRGVDGSGEPQGTVEFFPGLRAELTGKNKFFRWAAGAEGEYRTYRIQQGNNTRSAPAQLVDPYLEGRVGGALQLDAGVRLETLFVDGQLPRAEFSPRGSLRWRATDWLTLNAEASRSHRPPNPVLLVGLPDGVYLDLERADAIAGGVQLNRGPFQLELNGWSRWMRHLAGFEQDGSLGSLFGRAAGFESQAVFEIPSLSVRAIYQYTRSTRWEDPGSQLERNVTPWDQPHRIQLMALGQLPRNWGISGRFRYNSGFPSPRRQTDAYDILTDEVITLRPTDGRLKPYAALDVKITHRFLLRTWRLDVYLDLQNVTNARTLEPIVTGFEDSNPAYARGLPILPVFGVDGAFWPQRKLRELEERTPAGP